MPISMEKILFNVPIYIDSETEYYDFLTKSRDRSVERQVKRLKKTGLDPNGTVEQDIRDNPRPMNPERIPWKYNKIIGWIEIYANGGIIKTNLWYTTAQRISKRTKNTTITSHGKMDDVVDTYNLNNEEIRSEIEEYLKNLQKGVTGWNVLKKHHIDTSLLLQNLRYMDLKKMIEDLIQSTSKKQ